MIYDYHCVRCGVRDSRNVQGINRNKQTCISCGYPLTRMSHFSSVIIGIPAGFKTMFSDVHGVSGSPQREQFEKDVKSGVVQYAGKGSRWV